MPGIELQHGQGSGPHGKQGGRKTAIPKVGKGSGILDEHGVSFCLTAVIVSRVCFPLKMTMHRTIATCSADDRREYTPRWGGREGEQ